jgi:3-phenylpropionate/trans-cinnamate dioxygenase ferredoxin reductase subunit
VNEPIVVVGGGHAAAAVCAALVEDGLGTQLHLVSDEPLAPYHRPPLSKMFLKSSAEVVQMHRTQEWYRQAGITLRLGTAVEVLDRRHRRLHLVDGTELPYAKLVLATGARPRVLPGLTGLTNVAALRSASDAERLRGMMTTAQRVTVLGGGFVGLEVAATAAALGKSVTVLEAAPRLLGRSASAELSAHVLSKHRAASIDVRLGVVVDGFEFGDGQLRALRVDGVREIVDLLVLGIGALPDDRLARAAGLACDNGIVVDACLRSVDDPDILAIGDCANFPRADGGGRLRLESVQNATDQARAAAHTLQGREQPYAALPWFWSEQGGLRLQMAGLLPAKARTHRRPGANPDSFSLLHYVGERLACVESANAPLDHVMGRKILEAGKHPPPDQACNPAVALKTLL